MKILSIETSCDETAISIVEADGGLSSPTFKILGNALFSQIETHKEYGGVFPMMAKREHAKKAPVLLKKVLEESGFIKKTKEEYPEEKWCEIEKILEKEIGLYEDFRKNFSDTARPDIDVISVTYGPGLEPALWVGISFAKALGKLWDVVVVGINHMEGHILSVLIENTDKKAVEFPALALLISGAHTEIVEIESWGKYKIIGETRDDAVGEAFDKVARMMGLPYPGGPQISHFAEKARSKSLQARAKFTRPMIHSGDLNFSFSGLKTAVLYYIRDVLGGNENLTDADREDVSREFEDAVVEVLLSKTEKALEQTGAKTLIIAGGVISNKKIRETFMGLETKYEGLSIITPIKDLATDNALMIACATYINTLINPEMLGIQKEIKAKGNLRLE